MIQKTIELVEEHAYSAWSPHEISKQHDDVRIKILCYALLSANTHNIQPWKIKLAGNNRMVLYIDPQRLLPDTDPDYRHVYISQGTFLETLYIAATRFNMVTSVDLFPKGIDDLKQTGNRPIAEITFKEGIVITDKLFSYIPGRSTSHELFFGMPLSTGEKIDIINCHSKDRFEVRLIDSPELMLEINELLVEAMIIQTNHERTHLETIAMMRYRKKSADILRDGFTFSDLGVSGLKLQLLNSVANERFLRSNFFKKNVVRGTRKMAESARAYGVIYSPIDERLDQVVAGKVLTRLYLTVQKLGISLQPMDHVLQKYSELAEIENKMCDLLAHKGMVPQCFFRLGRTGMINTHHTPRRALSDLIINEE